MSDTIFDEATLHSIAQWMIKEGYIKTAPPSDVSVELAIRDVLDDCGVEASCDSSRSEVATYIVEKLKELGVV